MKFTLTVTTVADPGIKRYIKIDTPDRISPYSDTFIGNAVGDNLIHYRVDRLAGIVLKIVNRTGDVLAIYDYKGITIGWDAWKPVYKAN